jgi:RHH-type transcriptional regulator, rel operon repressor / antitoxin RelB
MNNVVATRFPENIIAELDEVARERKRTRTEIIREAVEIYLREWADYAIALERLRDPNDPIVPAEEFWAEVEQGEVGQDDGTEPARG